MEREKSYRIRVINVGSKSELLFAIDQHNFTIIEVDGKYVKKEIAQSIAVNVGQRYSLLFTANQNVDNYWVRAIYPNFFPSCLFIFFILFYFLFYFILFLFLFYFCLFLIICFFILFYCLFIYIVFIYLFVCFFIFFYFLFYFIFYLLTFF